MGDAPEAGDESEADEVRPTKVIVTEMALEVRCSRRQLDYEGRSDGRSMQTILTHIAPPPPGALPWDASGELSLQSFAGLASCCTREI